MNRRVPLWVALSVLVVALPGLLVVPWEGPLPYLLLGTAVAAGGACHLLGVRPMEARLRRLAGQLEAYHARDDRPFTDPGPADDAVGALTAALEAARRRVYRHYREQAMDHERLRLIFTHSNDAILLTDPASGRIVDGNPRAARLLGYPHEALLEQRLELLHPKEEEEALQAFVAEVLESGQGRSSDLHCRTRSGRLIPAEISASVLEMGEQRLLLSLVRDLSERKAAESEIQHLAYHDTLTDLPNRTLLKDRVESALARTRRSGEIGALLFLDLDNFKRINDSLGHSAGDLLLQELARRLKETLRAQDTVSRLGGDEFVVLIEQLGTDREAAVRRVEEVAGKIREVMARPFQLEAHELHVTVSIGIVTFPADGEDVEVLLRHADTAMYHAKGAGRDAARLFRAEMDEEAVRRLQVEHDIRQALRGGELELWFQPILAVQGGQLAGAEALLRWRQPHHGLVEPGEFLPLIEDSSLMLQLSDWVMEEAARVLAGLQHSGLLVAPAYLSVNLGHQQFHRRDFVQRTLDTLKAQGADPAQVQFEITETVIIEDVRETVRRLHRLRAAGIRFAIDDFGTGYSSLAHLSRLPVDSLKIDKAFVRDITTDHNDAAIVETILAMAEHLELSAIAEGVETREQLQFLRTNQCPFYQGHLARLPLSLAELEEELGHRRELAHVKRVR